MYWQVINTHQWENRLFWLLLQCWELLDKLPTTRMKVKMSALSRLNIFITNLFPYILLPGHWRLQVLTVIPLSLFSHQTHFVLKRLFSEPLLAVFQMNILSYSMKLFSLTDGLWSCLHCTNQNTSGALMSFLKLWHQKADNKTPVLHNIFTQKPVQFMIVKGNYHQHFWKTQKKKIFFSSLSGPLPELLLQLTCLGENKKKPTQN